MINPTRRSLLRGSVALAAGSTLFRPYIANATAQTATVWWTQGFAEEEDIAFRKIVADYEKASGNGGHDIVTKDGKLHLDDPKVRAAVIATLTYPTTAYREGFVPPGTINWNDADDNNAFHSKQTVMDLDGSLSTEVAIIKDKQNYDDIVTMGLALSNEDKPVPSMTGSFCSLIPKGAKNVAVAKDFLKYLIQPKVLNEYLKTGLGRREPPMPSIVRIHDGSTPRILTGRPIQLKLCSAQPCRRFGFSIRHGRR